MAVLMPFQAWRSETPAVYIPGEEMPRTGQAPVHTRDAEPRLFLYTQRFRFEGRESVRRGVMGLLNRSEATVFPHEDTEPGRVTACASQFHRDLGSLWLWCNDDAHALSPLLEMRSEPEIEVTDQFGCLHQVEQVEDPLRINAIQVALAGQPLFMADGHHRFAAGWNLATIQIRTDALRTRTPHIVADIERDARQGILLPPKSTDFYPKLAAGLIVYRPQNENVTPPVATRPGVRKPSS